MPTIKTLDDRREEFHNVLSGILANGHVYYQPLETVKISYPAMIYNRLPFKLEHADNRLYLFTDKYEVTYISHVPDDEVIRALMELPKSVCVRDFVSDNLYHYVFNIYH